MTTPTIRYVAEIDRPDHPYTGPAMLGTERVTVLPGRVRDVMPWTEAEVQHRDLSRTLENTGLLRAVVAEVKP